GRREATSIDGEHESRAPFAAVRGHETVKKIIQCVVEVSFGFGEWDRYRGDVPVGDRFLQQPAGAIPLQSLTRVSGNKASDRTAETNPFPKFSPCVRAQ